MAAHGFVPGDSGADNNKIDKMSTGFRLELSSCLSGMDMYNVKVPYFRLYSSELTIARAISASYA